MLSNMVFLLGSAQESGIDEHQPDQSDSQPAINEIRHVQLLLLT